MSDSNNALGRNDPCYCGSGGKYKRCCLDDDERRARGGSKPELDSPPFNPVRAVAALGIIESGRSNAELIDRAISSIEECVEAWQRLDGDEDLFRDRCREFFGDERFAALRFSRDEVEWAIEWVARRPGLQDEADGDRAGANVVLRALKRLAIADVRRIFILALLAELPGLLSEGRREEAVVCYVSFRTWSPAWLPMNRRVTLLGFLSRNHAVRSVVLA